METKDIKLSPKKGGHGHITSYSVILEKLIERERNPELREALEDLDDFLFGW